MPIKEKNQLKEYFRTGKKPTQQQFWEFLDSYYHKNEKLPKNTSIQYGKELSDTTDSLELLSYFIITDTGTEAGTILTIYQWNGKNWIELNNPTLNPLGTTDKTDFVIKTNNKQITRFTESGINFGDNYTDMKSNEIARFHAENKFAPSILLSNNMGKFGTPTLNLAIATDNGHFNRNVRKGDAVIIKEGGGGANLVIGTRTFTEAPDEETRIIIAPNSVKNNEAIVAKAITGSKTYVGLHTYNPTDYLEINSKTPNDSGVTFTQFNALTPATEGAQSLGITDKGKLVTVEVAPKDSGWIDMKLNNGIINYGAGYFDCQYRKIGKKLILRGLCKFTINSSNPVLFTLPEGFRPQKRFIATSTCSGSVPRRLDIFDNGNIQAMVSINKDQWVCIDGIELYLD